MKPAFTLIELIIVIALMSIISLIGVNIYINVYNNYITSRMVLELETKTEFALEQIVSRLTDRVKQATIGRNEKTDDIVLVYDGRLTDEHNILEWIGQSSQSRNLSSGDLERSIGWSGYLDLYKYEKDKSVYIQGNVKEAMKIIEELGFDAQKVGIIFSGVEKYTNSDNLHEGYGFKESEKAPLKRVMRYDMKNLKVIDYDGKKISDRYQLVHTAYAIVPKINKDKSIDLYLHYNYQPWNGESYKNTKKSLLVENVHLFRFRGETGSTINVKLCLKSDKKNNTLDKDFIVCKSKVVF